MADQDFPDIRTDGPALFLLAGFVAVILFAGLIIAAGFYIAPKADGVFSGSRDFVTIGAIALGIFAVVFYTLLGLSLVLGKKILPLPLARVQRLYCGLFPGARHMAKALGGRGTGMGRSFLIVQNSLVRAWSQGRRSEKVLVLLPHCLESKVKSRIDGIIEGYQCTARVVGGGSEAIEAIKDEQPEALVAVACERDLVSGVLDLGGRLPLVLAVPNIQRHGPCRETDVKVEEFEEALSLVAKKKRLEARDPE